MPKREHPQAGRAGARGWFHLHQHVALSAWLGVLCLAWTGTVEAMPAGFVLTDDKAGVTCLHYTRMGDLAWDRAGGDWLDAKGEQYGEQAFATVLLPGGKERVSETWDVTELARRWLDGSVHNAGLLLRTRPGAKSGTVDFLTRESPDEAGRPLLILTWSDGSRTRVPPAADTYLACTTRASLGDRPEMKVSRERNALVRFELPKSNGSLRRAELQLVSARRSGPATEVGAFAAAPPYARAAGRVATGLAQDYPADAGIDKNPDVLFATGFENPLWAREWSERNSRSDAEPVTEDAKRRFEALSGRALRVVLPKGKNMGLDMRYALAQRGQPEPEDIYFRYYLRFADDWNPDKDGGKLPGIAGTYGRGGWGMRRSDGYNGWSARGSFAQRPGNVPSMAQLTAIGSYAYHMGSDASGDVWPWSEGPSGLLQNNRWYAVEQYVKLNTPGVADGIFRAWIDGRQVIDKRDIQYRATPDLKIEEVWMNVYHGGTAVSPRDMGLFIDNVVIARRYIGPMKR